MIETFQSLRNIAQKSKYQKAKDSLKDLGFYLDNPEDKESIVRIGKLAVCIWKEYLGVWRCKMREDEVYLLEILKDERKKKYLYFRLATFILKHPKRRAHITLKDKLDDILRSEKVSTALARVLSGSARYALRPQLLVRGPFVSSASLRLRGQLFYESSKKLGVQVAKKLGLKFVAKKVLSKSIATIARLKPHSLVAIYFYDLVFSIIGQKELDRIVNKFLEKEPLD